MSSHPNTPDQFYGKGADKSLVPWGSGFLMKGETCKSSFLCSHVLSWRYPCISNEYPVYWWRNTALHSLPFQPHAKTRKPVLSSSKFYLWNDGRHECVKPLSQIWTCTEEDTDLFSLCGFDLKLSQWLMNELKFGHVAKVTESTFSSFQLGGRTIGDVFILRVVLSCQCLNFGKPFGIFFFLEKMAYSKGLTILSVFHVCCKFCTCSSHTYMSMVNTTRFSFGFSN